MIVLELIFGLVLVLWGADLLISSAIAIGKKFNLSDFFIGIIVVGFGTSLSELFVSIDAVIKNAGELSLGNVIGSNVANILLVLGFSSLVKNFKVPKVSKTDNLIHVFVSLLFLMVCSVSKITAYWGFLFIFIFICYIIKVFKNSKNNVLLESGDDESNDFFTQKVYKKPVIFGLPIVLLSIAITVLGADLTVVKSIEISKIFGISESVIGLTLIAIGTSLPEIAAGIASAKKSKFNLIIGNIVGSNLYNILLIIGSASFFNDFIYNKNVILYDLLFLNVCVLLFTLINLRQLVINKKKSVLLIFIYIFYIIYIYEKTFGF